MPTFRKKPVEIEARRFWGHEDLLETELAKWCGGNLEWRDNGEGGSFPVIAIETLEGTMLAKPGDWIMCGVKGEFYPCKPDIFEATYELTSELAN